jgi:hypothetical protein
VVGQRLEGSAHTAVNGVGGPKQERSVRHPSAAVPTHAEASGMTYHHGGWGYTRR